MNSLMDDRDDDVRLPGRGAAERRTMPRDAMRDEAVSHMGREPDREFTLSTGTVLGMFFALALICAVFFGFGYSMGRKSGQSSAEAASAPVAAESSADVAVSKPAAGAPAIQSIPGYMSQSEADAANRNAAAQTYHAPAASSVPAGSTTVVVSTLGAAAAKPVRTPVVTSDPAVSRPAPVVADRKPVPAVVASPAPIAAGAAAPGGAASYVQIAAVSHQEDADVLLSALKRRGYNVFARPGETDKLIHVQVGPFPTKKDADAMRQRLLGDGYNAIVK